MFNIFNTLKIYAESWKVVEERTFNEAELAAIDGHGIVEASKFGNSVQFKLKAGGQVYIPLSVDATVSIGDSIDPAQVTLIKLSKTGEDDIHRVMI